MKTIVTPPRFGLLGQRVLLRTARLWPDAAYLKAMYWLKFGKRLDLVNPQTYNEKCQWLKLYYRKPMFTTMVDKYEVKKYVSDRIGDNYVIPCLGVWDRPEDIEWERLPDQFVLKCTHDSGSVTVCKDKQSFDKEAAVSKLKTAMKMEYFYRNREWPYKNVRRRVIAEKYIDTLGAVDSVEYKVTCMNGKVVFVTVCTGVAHSAPELRKNDHYTPTEWEKLDWTVVYKPSGKDITRPPFMDEMVELCEKLAKDIPLLRIDWYVNKEQLLFGECTFYTWGGFGLFEPLEWAYKLGSWIQLPKKYND